ncbi:MAG: 50S ribosomal protein L17 [Candidatus Omnitrophota bacterium]|nr:50S ribosomal protein L17 [Candidatus Omnitrophota bacterium]
MRHKKKKGRLSRRTGWRKATLKSLTRDLLKYQRIETTMAKAKALRGYAEPLITLAKNDPDSVNAKRKAFQKLSDRDAVMMLFRDIAPLFKDVPGGYTRIMPLGNRKGDGARTVIMELTKRTISDDELLGIKEAPKVKPLKKKGKKAEETEEKTVSGKKGHSSHDIDAEKKEERVVESVRKERAKTEQKKVEKKGIFKRFQRKSI